MQHPINLVVVNLRLSSTVTLVFHYLMFHNVTVAQTCHNRAQVKGSSSTPFYLKVGRAGIKQRKERKNKQKKKKTERENRLKAKSKNMQEVRNWQEKTRKQEKG